MIYRSHGQGSGSSSQEQLCTARGRCLSLQNSPRASVSTLWTDGTQESRAISRKTCGKVSACHVKEKRIKNSAQDLTGRGDSSYGLADSVSCSLTATVGQRRLCSWAGRASVCHVMKKLCLVFTPPPPHFATTVVDRQRLYSCDGRVSMCHE